MQELESKNIGEGAREDHPGRKVAVTVDSTPHRVNRGRYLVSEFKALVGVDPGRDLDILRDGELVGLSNDEHILIHGGEVFVSHVPTGGSS